MAYGEYLTFRVVYGMNLPHAFSLTTHVLVGSYYQYHCRCHLSLDCAVPVLWRNSVTCTNRCCLRVRQRRSRLISPQTNRCRYYNSCSLYHFQRWQPSKSVPVASKIRLARTDSFKISCGSVAIESKSKITYLGLTFDNDMSFSSMVIQL